MNLTLIISLGSLLFSFVALSVMWLGKSKGNAVAFVFSIVGIVSAIVALSLSSPRDLSGNSEVDYNGLLIGILGVLVTVLVGLQLYQALNLKEDAKRVKESVQKAEDAKKSIQQSAEKVDRIEEQYKVLQAQFKELQEKEQSLRSVLSFVDNPEYFYAITDAEDKFLFGIKRDDGSIEWGAGVPEPIRKELDALKKRIAELDKK